MKKVTLFLVFLLFAKAGSAAELKVIIPNIKKVIGKISIGIFNNKKDHLVDGKAVQQARVSVDKENTTYIFKDLPEGDYSVAIFHDQNNDGICNTNKLGIPTEGYGFSNNVKPVFKDRKSVV